MKKIEEMSMQHQFTWNTLKMMDENERILGPQLQERAGVSDARAMYQIIKDLRHNGYLVGGNKSGERGYYEIRTETDLERTLHSLREPAYDLLNTADLMEKHFLNKEHSTLLVDEEESDDE